MNDKRVKLLVFVSIAIFLFTVPNITPISPITDLTKVDSDVEGDPETSYTYYGDQISESGSNIGTRMDANATIQDSMLSTVGTGTNRWASESSYYVSQTPWKFQLPSSYHGQDWALTGGTLSITGMTATTNHIPGDGVSLTEKNFASTAWDYAATSPTVSYSDSYWGETSADIFETDTQQVIAGKGYLADSSAYVVSGSTDFGSSTNGAGYIALNDARRTHTFEMSDDKTNPTLTDGTHSDDGTYSGRQEFSCTWGLVGNIPQSGSDSSRAENTGYASYNVATDINWEDHEAAGWNDDNSFWVEGTRNVAYDVYSNFAKGTTYGTAYNWVQYDWKKKENYSFQYAMDFYYKSESGDTPDANYYADISLTELGSLGSSAAGRTTAWVEAAGTINYIIKEKGGSTIKTIPKSFSCSSTDGSFSQTIADLTASDATSFGSSLESATSGKWYQFVIEISFSLTTAGHDKVEGERSYVGNGSVAAARVGPVAHTGDGVRITVSNPQVVIDENTKIDSNPSSTSYIEQTVISESIQWDNRTIPASSAVQMYYGYYVPTTVMGYNGANDGLGDGYMIAKIHVTKGGSTTTYSYDYTTGNSFYDVRNKNPRGLGTGTDRVIWNLRDTPGLIENLNRSQSFKFEVGLRLGDEFELDKAVVSTNCRVYFRNINFQVTTNPSAEALNAALQYQNYDGSATTAQTLTFVDDPLLPIATISFDDTAPFLSNYWDLQSDNIQEGFRFKMDEPLAFSYTATFSAKYEYWGTKTTMILTPTKTYFELNETLTVPKPYNYGTSYPSGTPVSETRWTTYWNDNFDVKYIIPKFTVGTEPYWDLDKAFVKYESESATVEILSTQTQGSWSPSTRMLVEETPSTYYGNPTYTTGNTQNIWIDNALYHGYVLSSSGDDIIDWDLRFSCPNDVGTVYLDDDTGFAADDANDKQWYNHSFYYSNTQQDYVYIKADIPYSTGGLATNDAYVYGNFRWLPGNGSYTLDNRLNVTYSSMSASANSISTDGAGSTIQASVADFFGSWKAVAAVYVKHVTGQSSSGNYPSGLFRGGMNVSNYMLFTATEVSINALSHTTLHDSTGNGSYTYLFDSIDYDLDALNDPNNMINLSVKWTDTVGNPIENDVSSNVRITMNKFINPVGGVNVPDLQFAFNNLAMNYGGDGIYWTWIDPRNMDLEATTGNCDWGYHEFNITLVQDGYDQMVLNGNFSILVDTELEVQVPAHSQVDNAGRHHYDGSGLIATDSYTITAKYSINTTSLDFQIDNNINSFYENNTFMTYELVSIHDAVDFSNVSVSVSEFANESYFNQTLSSGNGPYQLDDPTAPGWPTRGYMRNIGGGDHLFYATFVWPDFENVAFWDPNSGLGSHYRNQADFPKILEYNISVYARVNRTNDRYNEASLFQPNDLEAQDGEGVNHVGITTYTDYIRVREESVLLKLNDASTGNYTRLILTDYADIDGDVFALGTYNNDSVDLMDFQTTKYAPTYTISNYQNNMTYQGVEFHDNQFRFRAILNCSYIGALQPDEFYAGMYDDEWRPMGPVNATNVSYGVEFGWMGNTSIVLSGWNSGGINLAADSAVMYSCEVNTSSASPFTAYGVTYVSPWLNWSDKAAGEYWLNIDAYKEGFLSSHVQVRAIILSAPTAILNGSKSVHDIPTEKYGINPSTSNLNITTPTGIPVSFLLNFSDTTNYASHGIATGIPDASIAVTYDSFGEIWKNATGDVSTWKFDDLGNGIYNVTILDTNVDVFDDNGETKQLNYLVSKTNYTSSTFRLNINFTKRQSELRILSAETTDFYYAYPSNPETPGIGNWYSVFDVSQLKVSVQFWDLDLDEAVYLSDLEDIVMGDRLNQGDNFHVDDAGYQIVRGVDGSGDPILNFTIGANRAPGEYELRFLIENVKNYHDAFHLQNITIQPGDALVDLVWDNTRYSVPFYMNVSSTAEEAYLPYYSFKFIDAHYTYNGVGGYAPIVYGTADGVVTTSNFDNTIRSLNYFNAPYDYRTYGISIDGDPAIKYIPDITGIQTNLVGGEYQNESIEVYLSKSNFNLVTYEVDYQIVNATTRLFTYGGGTDRPQEVYVKLIDSSSPSDMNDLVGGIVYRSQFGNDSNIPFSKPVYYNFLVQVQIGYFAFLTKESENIAAFGQNPLNLEVNGEYSGIDVNIENQDPYPVIWFVASPTGADYLNVTYSFTIWEKNYAPRSYNLTFNIVPHETGYTIEQFDDSVSLMGELIWKVHYFDLSDGVIATKQSVSSAFIYPQGNMSAGVGSGQKGMYYFDDETAVEFSVIMVSPGRYQIVVDTNGLNVGNEYALDFSIGKEHFIVQEIRTTNGEVPEFHVTAVQLEGLTWFDFQDIDPGTNSMPTPSTYPASETFVNIFVWLRTYIEIDGEPVTISEGLSVSVNLTEVTFDPGTNIKLSRFLWSFDLVFEENTQLWKGEIDITPTNEIKEQLQGLIELNFTITSEDPNFEVAVVTRYLTIPVKINEAPPWVYWVMAASIGSMLGIAGYGVKKALSLRIPFVLRMIDESIDKISKDKFPTVGVMLGRREFVINKVIDYLDLCGIEWAIDEKFEEEEMDDLEEGTSGDGKAVSGSPLSKDEVVVRLNNIPSLTADERALFIDEILRLDRKEQEDFLKSLSDES